MDDKQLEQLLAELKRYEDSTMTEFKCALLALLIEELHWGFVQY